MVRCLFLSVLFVAFCSSCGNSNSSTNQINKNLINELKWLEGSWLDTITFKSFNPPREMYEKWNWFSDSIVGVGGHIIDADTIITENIIITYVDTSLVYIARVKDRSMLSYNLVYNKLDSIVFENKAHDFPQHIIYKKTNSNSIYIYLNGYSSEMSRKLRFSCFKSDF